MTQAMKSRLLRLEARSPAKPEPLPRVCRVIYSPSPAGAVEVGRIYRQPGGGMSATPDEGEQS